MNTIAIIDQRLSEMNDTGSTPSELSSPLIGPTGSYIHLHMPYSTTPGTTNGK